MTIPVSLTESGPIALAVIRRRVRRAELGMVVPQTCGLVWNFVRERRIPAGRNVAVYLNGAIDIEVGVEVTAPFEEGGDVVLSQTPSGLIASAVHFGPYQQLGAAHSAIRSWCEANGHRLAGPNWEIYGHWQTEWNEDASRIRTDVFYQLARP
jgi:effector-binding domain-containing protein